MRFAVSAVEKSTSDSHTMKWRMEQSVLPACRTMRAVISCAACARHSRRKKAAMTLSELSEQYRVSADLVRGRLKELRAQQKQETDPQTLFWIGRRMAVLTQLLQQSNELAELTEHYYERGYWRNEKYRL